MGSLNDKEKEFKSVLENLEFEIDTAQIWSNVSPHLKEKKKDRPFFFYFLGLSLAILFGGGAVYLMMSDASDNSNNKVVSEFELTSDLNAESHTQGDKTLAFQKRTNTALTTKGNSEKEASGRNFNSISNNSIADNKIQFQTISNDFGQGNSNVSSEKTLKNDYNKKISPSNSFNDNTLKTTPIHLFTNSVSEFKYNSSNSNVSNNDDIVSLNILTDDKDNLNKKFPALFVDGISPQPLLKERSIEDLNLESRFHLVEVVERIDNSWLPVYSFISGVNKSISSPELININSDFDSNTFGKETGLYGTLSALRMGFENRKGWTIFGVLSYTTQNSVYRNQDIQSSTATVQGSGEHINTNGFVETQNVDLLQTTTVYSDLNWNRRHKYIDLGMGVSKQVLSISNVYFSVESSLHYNLSSQHKGYYFDEVDSNIIKFDNGEDNIYRNRTSLSGVLGMRMEWRYKNIGLGVSPFMRIRMNSITQESNFYNINDNHFGLNFSLSYRPF